MDSEQVLKWFGEWQEQMEKVKPAYFTEKVNYSVYGLHNA